VAVRWDNSQVLALQEAESSKWERAVNALSHGGITVNDFRRIVGLDTDAAGDVFLLPRGAVPLPMGALPQAGDVIGAQPPVISRGWSRGRRRCRRSGWRPTPASSSLISRAAARPGPRQRPRP